MITQKDIAHNLGVSRETVKFALNGNGGVAAATRERVLREAERMGYSRTSNTAARTLAAQRNGSRAVTGTIAVVSAAAFDSAPLRNVPFFAPLFAGIEAEARIRDLDICLLPLREERLPRLISERGVDGAICLGEAAIIPRINEFEVPIVGLDVYSDCAPHIVPADRKGMKLATRHLIELGHRRIAFIGHGLHFPSAVERFEGYRAAMNEAGLGLDEKLIETTLMHSEAEHGGAAAERVLSRTRQRTGKPTFTAIVCYHDLFAMGAVRALQAAGLRVPDDVAVVGFDDVSTHYSFAPAITSVSFDRHAMGRRAVQVIGALLEGETIETQHEVFPVELVVRDSTRAVRTP